MRIISVLLRAAAILALCLSACAPGAPAPSDSPNGDAGMADDTNPDASQSENTAPDESVTPDESGMPDESGNTETQPIAGGPIGAGSVPYEDLPVGWREDVPLMAGFTVIEFDTSDGGMMAICEGTVDQASAVDFYQNLEGWEVDESRADGGQHEVTGSFLPFKKGNVLLSVAVGEADGATQLNLMVITR